MLESRKLNTDVEIQLAYAKLDNLHFLSKGYLLMSSTAVFFFVILHQSIQLCYMWGTYNGLRCSYKFQHACSEKRKAIVLAQCSLTNGFKLQSINFSPTRAGSLHEKCENDWKNSTNSHLFSRILRSGIFFFVISTMRPIKSLIL